MLKKIVLNIAAAAITLVASATYAADTRSFSIPPGELAPALESLAKETGLELIFQPDELKGMHTQGVTGNLSPQEAVAKLIDGTKLTIRTDSAGVILISPEASAPIKTSAASSNSTQLRLAQAEAQSTDSTASPSQSAVDNSEKIQEIVVTAQKKRERLQDVPTSMVVLSADRLEDQGLTRLADYAKVTPGLMLIGAAGAGAGAGAGQVVLRGINSGSDRNALVGQYLDDVPFTSSSPRFQSVVVNLDPALADVDRIEVLKGPQSTLYGASAMGGLIKFVSKKPNLQQFEGSMLASGSTTEDGGSGYSARLSLNTPIVTDKVAVRGSVFYRKDPGYVKNLVVNDENSVTVKGARASLLAQLTENLETTFTGFLQKTTGDALSNVFINLATQQPILGQLANSTPVDERNDVESQMFSNYTAWTLPFGTLSNTASYSKLEAQDVYDHSATAVAVGGSSVVYGMNHTTKSTRRYTDELRLASAPGRFEWIAGLFYTDEKALFDWVINGLDSAGNLLPTTIASRTIDIFHTTGDYEEKAAFGNMTYHFTDRLEATAGARYTTNDQSFVTNVSGVFRNFNVGHPASDSSKDYLATLSFKPRSDLTLYARAASAYRPGGPNSLSPANEAIALASGAGLDFKADHLWNYEVGIKGSALDGMLAYSAAAYYMDWDDIQVNVNYSIVTSTGVTTNLAATGNAGTAESEGVEAQLHLRLQQGFSLGLTGSFNKAQLTSNAPGVGVKGDTLPYTPKWSTAAMLDYSKEVSNGITAEAGLTYAYTSSRVNQMSLQSPVVKLDAFDTLDIRGGLHWSQYGVIARVDNVLNEDSLQAVPALSIFQYRGATPLGIFLRPRTYSLSLQVKF